MTDTDRIIAEIHRLLNARGPGKSICPSEVARHLGNENWRDLMPAVREAAAAIGENGGVIATQKGRRVDPVAARGPIRLARPVAMGAENGIPTPLKNRQTANPSDGET
ncbi:MAG: DUF3253 domain-containing protein [Pseudomonadota bacterium]